MTAVSPADRQRLRDLARRVADIAQRPEQAAKRRAWIAHNALRERRPLVLCFPEGAWLECISEGQLQVQDPFLRSWETRLRMAVYTADVLQDDQPIDAAFNVPWDIGFTGWGVTGRTDVPDAAQRRTYYVHPYLWLSLQSHSALGAYHQEPPLQERADFARLQPNRCTVNRESSRQWLEQAHDLFDGILEVRRRGNGWFVIGAIPPVPVQLRGMDNFMLDMIDAPEFVHELVRFVATSHQANLDLLEREGLLTLNNGSEWIGTGGIGYTDELPAAGFRPEYPRCRDLWGGDQAQDLVGISGDMFGEFFLPQVKLTLERFGLATFGCCEPIHHWWPQLQQIRNLRRVSISAWADVRRCAEALGGNYVSCYKPNPAALSGERVDWDGIRRELMASLRLIRQHGCVAEIIMKDLHTLHHDVARLPRWVALVREAADEVFSQPS